MEKNIIIERINKAGKLADEIRRDLREVVFPDNIDDVSEFEKLPRQERYGLAGILELATELDRAISLYNSWFGKLNVK